MECPKVSVIIPVYNVERYLRQCLDSAVNQTLREIEIICVDDGSTDGSLEILREYQEKDSRVTVFSQNNDGPSAARNRGLEHARGRYVQFLDSDDFLCEDALEKLYDTASEKDLDALFFDFERFYDDAQERTKSPVQFCRKEYAEVYDGVSFIRTLKDEEAYTTSACIILIRREFLKDSGLSFYNGILHEDELFCFRLLMLARRVSHMGQPFYRRRIRIGSIVPEPKTHENVMGCFICTQEMLRYGLSLKDDEARMFEALRAFTRMQYSSRDYYMQISQKEQGKVKFENPFSQLLFDAMVASAGQLGKKMLPDNTAQMTKAELERQLRVYEMCGNAAHQEIIAIRSSVSYKIGRMVTWVPRKIRGAIRCYRENGIKHTASRVLEHLHLKKTAPAAERKDRTEREQYEYCRALAPEKYEEELKLWYEREMGEKLNLQDPKSFNHKVQWMKLYDCTETKTRLADKYLVRDWICEKIGAEYLIPLLGVWDSFDQIDFDKLPDQFVLKANHGSGWNIIVKDKRLLDVEDARKKFEFWMKRNYAFKGFELHYANIPPKIIAEQYVEELERVSDYKFMCFDGEVEFLWVDTERYIDHRQTLYTPQWERIHKSVTVAPPADADLPRPKNLERMLEIARTLSRDFAFVRVDLYADGDKIYFGEMTFTPWSGKGVFQPKEFGMELGDRLNLPEKKPLPERRRF